MYLTPERREPCEEGGYCCLTSFLQSPLCTEHRERDHYGGGARPCGSHSWWHWGRAHPQYLWDRTSGWWVWLPPSNTGCLPVSKSRYSRQQVLRRKAVSSGRKHCHFPWCHLPRRLTVSWLCLSGGGCSVVKVSQPVTVVCSSSEINGVFFLKAQCTVLSCSLSLSPLSREAPALCLCSTGAEDLQQPWTPQWLGAVSCCSPHSWQTLHDQVLLSHARVLFPAFLVLKHKQMLQFLSQGKNKHSVHRSLFLTVFSLCSLRDGILLFIPSFLYPVC